MAVTEALKLQPADIGDTIVATLSKCAPLRSLKEPNDMTRLLKQIPAAASLNNVELESLCNIIAKSSPLLRPADFFKLLRDPVCVFSDILSVVCSLCLIIDPLSLRF